MFFFNQLGSNEQPQWLELQSECLVASLLNNSGQGPAYRTVQFMLWKSREVRRNKSLFTGEQSNGSMVKPTDSYP